MFALPPPRLLPLLLQDTVSAAAPKGWEVEIADVSIGTLAPQMRGKACGIY